MRILQVVKTTEGAGWAAWQSAELVKRGVEVHVALPAATGGQVQAWKDAGAVIHTVPMDLPVTAPWRIPEVLRRTRHLVDEVQPDLIHSHFVGTTLTLRRALGKNHPIPRVFQVAGPLHLEHWFYRSAELASAGPRDSWICSSRCISDLLQAHGVDASRLFLSYYGWQLETYARERTNTLRRTLGIQDHELMVGNISWLYKPKYHLGQRVGLKCHEDMIDALAIVVRERPDVVGVLVGGAFGGAVSYEKQLRARAESAGKGRIKMPGHLPPEIVKRAWPDFDCAIHVPLSENCGGVLEPLYAGIPTIAAKVGGLPELVVDGVTGTVIPGRQPALLAQTILKVLSDLPHYRELAENGHELVKTMFDIRRTAAEIYDIYEFILGKRQQRPTEFDSRAAIGSGSACAVCR